MALAEALGPAGLRRLREANGIAVVVEVPTLSKRVSYNPGPIPFFSYFHDDHEELLAKLQICEHYGAIYDVRRNDVPRWNLDENFAEYPLGQ